MSKKISYKAMMSCRNLSEFNAQSQLSKETWQEKTKMTEISWDEALASPGYVKLESEKRKTLVVKNPRLENIQKFGELTNVLTLDVVEEDDKPAEPIVVDGVEQPKRWEVNSKRLLKKLRPLFENVDPDTEVRLSVKKLGDKFETSYDVESL